VTLDDGWQLGPFTRDGRSLLGEQHDLRFDCPVRGESVQWAAKDVFNPGAVVHDGKVHLLVRGEDPVGRYAGTSRIGLATSDDGVHFAVEQTPVLFPADDEYQAWEWPGGCEDPRVVESPDGGFVCLYSAFDGKSSTLCAATSLDLRAWRKEGPALAGTPYAKRWSKSGSIVTEVHDNRLVAARLNGRFWMYWGEGVCYAATSEDLIRWTPVEFDPGADRYLTFEPTRERGTWGIHRVPGQNVLRPAMTPRRGRFDSMLVEPGPPAVVTDDGIVLIYNGANHPVGGDAAAPAFAYQPGQALFDALDPSSVIARSTEPFVRVGDLDRIGQVGNVCFAQALVLHREQWILYLGLADSRIGCATAPA